MAATDVIKTSLERNWGMVDRALEGLDDATLSRQINDQSNSIAWLLFHMNRVVDVFTNTRLRSKAQLWTTDGWCAKFGLTDDPETTGQGWSSERLAAWAPPSRDVLVGYYEAVKANCREYLSSITDADLEGSVNVPPAPEPRPVQEMLGILVFDNVVHGGQIAFLRGYMQGMGWFG
jgi:hypothetical protein